MELETNLSDCYEASLLTMDQVLIILAYLNTIRISFIKRETKAEMVFLSKCSLDKYFWFRCLWNGNGIELQSVI